MQPHGLLLSLIEHWETGLVNDWVRWAAVHGVTKSRTRLSDFTFTFHFHALEKEMATHSSVLAWRIPGTGEPRGLPSMGLHRGRHDWSDLAAAADYMCMSPISSVSLQTLTNTSPSSSGSLLFSQCGVHQGLWGGNPPRNLWDWHYTSYFCCVLPLWSPSCHVAESCSWLGRVILKRRWTGPEGSFPKALLGVTGRLPQGWA